ncbi:MAG TPA: alpha/beta fold hydrolase [Frankiaceae bacterium]|nr:alpha/beta fold hydrolase [Frankiaceae bacterium]
MSEQSRSNASTFVLVHGGGHGGWCWQRLAKELRSRGHEVWTPTLTGFGERRHLDSDGVTFETFVTDIVSVLEYEDLRDVVLVGHSMGGVIVPRVAEVASERIRAVVWMAAVVLNDDETLLEAVPQTPEVAKAVVIQDDGSVRTDPQLMIEALLPEGTDQERAWVLARHRPYPPMALVEPGRLTAFKALGLPTGYILATLDLAVAPDRARAFSARLPGVRYAEVEAGHDLMLTRPKESADALLSVSERRD